MEKESQERDHLQEEILRLQKECNEKKIFSAEEINKAINFSEHAKKWHEALAKTEQTNETLQTKAQNLLEIVEEFKTKYQNEHRENNENKNKIIDLVGY